VGDERAIAPSPHVHLEDVRAVVDRGRERLEAVLERPRPVAAVRDAERVGYAERLGDGAAQRNEAQGSSDATSTSS
jgi:hypothetical protein